MIDSNSGDKVVQGPTEGNADACSLLGAQGDQPSNDGIRSHWNRHNTSVTKKNLYLYFLRIGAFVFGGPVVLVRRMHEDMVIKYKWFTELEFNEGFTLSQMSPGPLATQIGIYLCWLRFGAWGGFVGLFFFILPSFLIVVALAMLYRHYGQLNWVKDLFWGINPSMIALVGYHSFHFTKKTLGNRKSHDKVEKRPTEGIATARSQKAAQEKLPREGGLIFHWICHKGYFPWTVTLLFISITLVKGSIPFTLFLIAGICGAGKSWLEQQGPSKPGRPFLPLLWWNVSINSPWVPSLANPILNKTSWSFLGSFFWIFFKAGAMVFGSGLAIVPFLQNDLVHQFHLLTNQQFLDAVTVALITPGPVVITTAFMGYLIHGWLGALLAAIATFLPCYFVTILVAPLISRLKKYLFFRGTIEGITAAALGFLLGSALLMAQQILINPVSWVIAGLSLGIFIKFKKIPEALVLYFFGLVGLLLSMRVTTP